MKQKANEAVELTEGGVLARVIVCVWVPWIVVVVAYHCQLGGTASTPTSGMKKKTRPTASMLTATATTTLVPVFVSLG